jgi:hypothetical protein
MNFVLEKTQHRNMSYSVSKGDYFVPTGIIQT